MSYSSLRACLLDLEANGELIRVHEQVDPDLQMAAVHRRVYQAQGPALWFTNVKGTPFTAVSNLYGTLARARFLFRRSLPGVLALMRGAANPPAFLQNPWQAVQLPRTLAHALPKRDRQGPVLENTCSLSQLPPIRFWPRDGGPFITLGQVCTQDPDRPGIGGSNLGMYRVQLAGNAYQPEQQVGMHYQIHRGIGVHHQKALAQGKPLRVSIFVGGPPSHAFSAVMPLPEGMPELLFAGLLGGRRVRYTRQGGYLISTEADFCIVGTIEPDLLPEGPFGDHLGYYSLQHPFPVLRVEKVFHRGGAIWPFTVVGRPPQEDTVFGELIHEITGPVIPTKVNGLKEVNAVDAAGVHPLLLAIGQERYVPYQERKPMELLTIANSILGQGQMSLAKYLLIVASEDDPSLRASSIRDFLLHLLQRIDLTRDLHFHTQTTMDTLDYSGGALNSGSKLVMAAAGKPRRTLSQAIPSTITDQIPDSFGAPKVVIPGIMVVQAHPYLQPAKAKEEVEQFCIALQTVAGLEGFPLIVVVDDSSFCAASLNNFLWVTFTRSDPAADSHGVRWFWKEKHWGCRGSLVIDARRKPHHAPPLEVDPAVERSVDALAAPGKSLHGIF